MNFHIMPWLWPRPILLFIYKFDNYEIDIKFVKMIPVYQNIWNYLRYYIIPYNILFHLKCCIHLAFTSFVTIINIQNFVHNILRFQWNNQAHGITMYNHSNNKTIPFNRIWSVTLHPCVRAQYIESAWPLLE